MTILALEFSSDRRSAAVLVPGRAVIEAHALGNTGAAPLELVVEVLRLAGCEREAIQCVAIGAGPGSYAGIRVAIAMAQGWDLALPVKLCAISSADCLAAGAHAEGNRGIVNVVLDAQRGEFYLGRYELTPEDWRTVEPLRIVSRADVEGLLARGEATVGPLAEEFKNGVVKYPEARQLAGLAGKVGRFVSAAELEPIYLRPVSFVKASPPRIIPPVA